MCTIFIMFLQYPITILYDPTRKKELPSGVSAQYRQEKETCMKLFEKWSEPEQVNFVEQLLTRMCHYQHGHINAYLKPMLQRDFISLLPSEYFCRDIFIYMLEYIYIYIYKFIYYILYNYYIFL